MVKNRFYRFIRATWRPFATFLHPLRVEGLENLPKDQPVLLCANHSSAVDPILLICAMRQDFPLRIMAKKQLMKIPVVGAFLRAIGVFGVDRGNSDIAAVKTSIQSLRDGWYLLAFCLITCIVNSINCIWVAVAGLLVPDFIYNIGTTVLNGGISMVIFFFVNKIIFPEGEAKQA